MPEALDVTCPCCEALLKVDPETGSVVWADRKKAPPKDFDDLVSRVQSQKSGRGVASASGKWRYPLPVTRCLQKFAQEDNSGSVNVLGKAPP